MFRHDRIMLKSRLIRIMCIPKMNLPVPPFEKGGLGGISSKPPLKLGRSIPLPAFCKEG